jgi:hypothetical protein
LILAWMAVSVNCLRSIEFDFYQPPSGARFRSTKARDDAGSHDE